MGTHGTLNRSFTHTQLTFDQLLKQYQSFGFKKNQIVKAWQQCGYNNQTFHDELIKITQEENALIMNEEELLNSQFQLKRQLKLIEDEDLKKAIQLSMDQNIQPQVEQRPNNQTPVGLKNLGNTCYMNAMLQTMFGILPLRDLLFSLELKGKTTPGAVFLLRLSELFYLLKEGTNSYVSPAAFFDALAKFKPRAMLVKGVQNDFNELQNALLDAIEEALKEIGGEELKKQFCSMFYGESKEILSYKESQQEVIRVNETTFGSISIEASDKSLNKGFTNTRILRIDEFETDNKEKTTAKIEQNILVPPKVLSFYINRVYYDPKQKQACKNNTQFEFPTELNINEFKISNLGEVDKELKKLDQEEQMILDEIRSHGDSKEDIAENFDKIIKLFKRGEGQIDQLPTIDGFCICDETTGNTKLIPSDNMLYQLINYKEKFVKKVQLLTEQLDRIQIQKKKLLKNDQNMYHLTGVLMHDGGANSGHYYCYVLDKSDLKTWWKCNDQTVTKVDYATVEMDAIGNNKVYRNVSGLIYEQQQWMTQVTTKQVNPQLLSIIKEDQDKNSLILDQKKILARQSVIVSQLQNQKPRAFKNKDSLEREFERFSNFDLFLLTTNEKIYQYYLTMQVIQSDLQSIKNTLSLPQNFDQYFKYFIEQTKIVTTSQENELQSLQEEFMKINSLLQQLPFKEIIITNYEEKALYYSIILQHLSKRPCCTSTYKYVKELYQAVLLKGCFFIDLKIQSQSLTECVQIAQIVLHQIQNPAIDELIVKQIKDNLKSSAEQVKLITKRTDMIDSITTLKQKPQTSLVLQQQKYRSLEQEIQNLVALKSNSLKLWLQFQDTLLKTQKLIPQQDRQNQEAILYFG